jgi:methionyl-tRNA formyltransferase
MNILYLSPHVSLVDWLRDHGEPCLQTMDVVTPDMCEGIEFLISYGYRHIISKDVLDIFPDRAINLHISLLPWNRGADPNLWSFIDDTPKGVTIHYLDGGIDTGDIIAQDEVMFSDPKSTLQITYNQLHFILQRLFMEQWNNIKDGFCNREKQRKGGTYHSSKDKDTLKFLLTDGWLTPVSKLKLFPSINGMTNEWVEAYLKTLDAKMMRI